MFIERTTRDSKNSVGVKCFFSNSKRHFWRNSTCHPAAAGFKNSEDQISYKHFTPTGVYQKRSIKHNTLRSHKQNSDSNQHPISSIHPARSRSLLQFLSLDNRAPSFPSDAAAHFLCN